MCLVFGARVGAVTYCCVVRVSDAPCVKQRLCAAALSTPDAPGPTPMTVGKAKSRGFNVINNELGPLVDNECAIRC
jgi:hypothetical protein